MITELEKKLLKELTRRGYISKEDLDVLVRDLASGAVPVVEAVRNLNVVSVADLYAALSEVTGYAYVQLSDVQPDSHALQRISAKVAKHYALVPVSYADGSLVVCFSDPFNVQTIDEIQALLVDAVDIAVAPKEEIDAAIKRWYGVGAAAVQSAVGDSTTTRRGASEALDLEGKDSHVAQFVNQVLYEAKMSGATDIHIEPFEKDVKVRYRIDGVLSDVAVPAQLRSLHESIVARIKIIADLDVSERRLPQDGRLKITSKGEEMDLRISILPTAFGESVNIRLLSSNVSLGLESLGFEQDHLTLLHAAIKKPHGIVLLTGPTGSGKTTTLYACMHKVNDGKKKIITIEDPIEYQVSGVSQIQVHPKIGLTFSAGLRSMLRHDPDIMMVGEIRDIETAVIAMRVALTGHLVFSTLHTNDAISAVTRLVEMGVEPYLVSSGVECVIAQRLVRKLCQACRTEDPEGQAVAAKVAKKWQVNAGKAYKAVGCDQCRGTGYAGRTAIHEILPLTADIRALVAKGCARDELKKTAVRQGMRLLREDGYIKVAQGVTSIEEVVRATEDEE